MGLVQLILLHSGKTLKCVEMCFTFNIIEQNKDKKEIFLILFNEKFNKL